MGKKFSADLSKVHSVCPENDSFCSRIFFEKILFFLCTFSEKFSDFQQKFFVEIGKSAFYESMGSFWDFEKKREVVHFALAGSGDKNQPTEGKFFFRNLNCDGK